MFGIYKKRAQTKNSEILKIKISFIGWRGGEEGLSKRQFNAALHLPFLSSIQFSLFNSLPSTFGQTPPQSDSRIYSYTQKPCWVALLLFAFAPKKKLKKLIFTLHKYLCAHTYVLVCLPTFRRIFLHITLPDCGKGGAAAWRCSAKLMRICARQIRNSR